jgi:hypothetical protein
MKRPASLALFFIGACAWFLVLSVGWIQVARWTSYPAASVAQIILDSNALDWVASTQNVPGQLKVRTKFNKLLPGGEVATPIAVVEPAHCTYGIAVFLALLLAARSKRFVSRALAGYVLLLIPQAFSIVFVVLGQIVREVPFQLLGISVWQVDAIIVSNVFGTIILPTLAPVCLWLWMEEEFFVSLVRRMASPPMRANPAH